jgi:hypothetical protein
MLITLFENKISRKHRGLKTRKLGIFLDQLQVCREIWSRLWDLMISIYRRLKMMDVETSANVEKRMLNLKLNMYVLRVYRN